ncbi:hypothetical protein AB0D08_33055 [Kitasatospora sp. NPDC048540]|uniref:hypothetical protein n=1 Tax=Kitasatospora sp. NPDC048540 TaxID=3155634 RepID=UPI0033FAE5A9
MRRQIEAHDVRRIWIGPFDSSAVCDAAGGEPLRRSGADAALALLRRTPGGAPRPLVDNGAFRLVTG